jgi:hypothetical protein
MSNRLLSKGVAIFAFTLLASAVWNSRSSGECLDRCAEHACWREAGQDWAIFQYPMGWTHCSRMYWTDTFGGLTTKGAGANGKKKPAADPCCSACVQAAKPHYIDCSGPGDGMEQNVQCFEDCTGDPD